MKYALITGATSGIGREVALKLHSLGWFIGLIDLDADKVREFKIELNANRTWGQAADVTDVEQLGSAIAAFAEITGGQLDLLFNSAGLLEIGHFEQINLKRHNQIVDVNINGVINCCHLAFPYLKATTHSHVINMCSASAQYGVPRLASYSATKFAVKGLTEALEIEWAPYDIKVSDIMPPFVSTPMLNDQQQSAPVLKQMGVNLEAGDVADAVVAVLDKPVVHKPVSLQFTLLYRLGELLPGSASRMIMKMLNKE